MSAYDRPEASEWPAAAAAAVNKLEWRMRVTSGSMKYTDRDVRERPELVAEAIRYLRWYQGEFEFLVDAKRYEQANGNLPLATARGVLNCIRQDARYALVSDPIPEPVYEPLPRKPRPLRVVKTPVRRFPFDLKTHWNARLLYSSHKSAQIVHALRLSTKMKYYPMSDGGKFIVYGGLRSLCSTGYGRATQRLAREMPEGRRFCKRCAEAIEEYGYNWGPTIPPDLDKRD